MTEQEAMNVLEKYTDDTLSPVVVEAHRMAITALEEIQQYRAMQSDIRKNNAELLEYRTIGTVEEFREAVEKQRAKKPNLEGDGCADGQIVYDTWICPCCEKSYEIEYEDHKHCPNCGQNIDWSV